MDVAREYEVGKIGRINGLVTEKKAASTILMSTKAPQMQVETSSEKEHPKSSSTINKKLILPSNSDAQNVRNSGLRSKIAPKMSTVGNWDKEEVSRWLVQLNLAEYCDVFVQNQINGEVLLELSLDDLDYMSIKALGHRKTILKEIEYLRDSIDPKCSADNIASESPTCSLHPSTSSNVATDVTSRSTNPAKIHWSHLEPLSSDGLNQHVHGANHVNVADLSVSCDVLDEDAEHAAFQLAVLEWRNAGDASSSISTASDHYLKCEVASLSKNLVDNSEWMNPYDDVGEVKSSDSNETTSFKVVSEPIASMANGELKEQEEFKKAVAAWKNGTTKKKLQEVVQNVSMKLEEEFSEYSLTLERQKEEAIEKLNETRLKASQSHVGKEEWQHSLSVYTDQMNRETEVGNEVDCYVYKQNAKAGECAENQKNETIDFIHKRTEIMSVRMMDSVIDYDRDLLLTFNGHLNYLVVEYDSENEASEKYL